MFIRWWIVMTLAAVAFTGCGGRDAGQQAPPETAGKGAVTIVGKDNVFEPDTVEIKADREYEFTFKNEGTAVHNFIVEAKGTVGKDFSSDAVVDAGQTGKFTVKISPEGTYPMKCTLHPEMIGSLKVVK